ncbi:DUF7674 family protein [Undibacterium parvum]|uniref:Uncharacterized protein n=2 Tax=Undibacterium TaxID=401469 RepID=A0A6M4A1K2_9BURK|nr:hypothetical protein [Undibacterium parvum]AZP14076.1 hypothetical protein EJN92_19980 [Undibacterium parvum]QJQ05024.1 hypothetical protein EJG51_003165 [Undibacterium piscinae]
MMEASCVQFIEKLMNTSNFLQGIALETLEYWEPDLPPVTILFAAIGKELTRRFDSMGNESIVIVFELIEDAMNANDNVLKSAVATGIIEAIISESSRNDELWSRIESQLGSTSKHHAEGWRNTAV